MITTHNS